MSFRKHCEQLGIILLNDDIKFIKTQLQRIPYLEHRNILTKYTEIWLEAKQQAVNINGRDNVGRRAANLYLLGV